MHVEAGLLQLAGRAVFLWPLGDTCLPDPQKSSGWSEDAASWELPSCQNLNSLLLSMDFTSLENCWLVCGCQESACDFYTLVMWWNYLNICSIQACCISNIDKIANHFLQRGVTQCQICTKTPECDVFSIFLLHLLLFRGGLNSLFAYLLIQKFQSLCLKHIAEPLGGVFHNRRDAAGKYFKEQSAIKWYNCCIIMYGSY